MADVNVQVSSASLLTCLQENYDFYATPPGSLFSSGFLNSANFLFASPQVLIKGDPSSWTYSVMRDTTAKAAWLSDARTGEWSMPSGVIERYGKIRAINSVKELMTGRSFNGSTTENETTLTMMTLPMKYFSDTDNFVYSSRADFKNSYLSSGIRASLVAASELILGFFHKEIESSHNIKKDNDGYNLMGTPVSFANEDNVPPTHTWNFDFTSSTTGTPTEKIGSITTELDIIANNGPIPMDRDFGTTKYCLLPRTAYLEFRKCLNTVMTNMQNSRGNSDSVGDGYGLWEHYFDWSGTRFVNVPEYMVKTTGTAPNDGWIGYLLSPGSFIIMMNPVPTSKMLWTSFGQGGYLGDMEPVRRSLVQNQIIKPNMLYEAMSANRADPYLNLDRDPGVTAEKLKAWGPMTQANAFQVVISQVPVTNTQDRALDYTIQCKSTMALMRTRPHFIHKIIFPKSKFIKTVTP